MKFIIIASILASTFADSIADSANCVVNQCKSDFTNVGCIAACYGVPNPNEDMIQDTAKCYAACDNKVGTEAQDCFTDSSKNTASPTNTNSSAGSSSSASGASTNIVLSGFTIASVFFAVLSLA
ncbi:hypothetical protein BB559_002071 [Furculomyces boomerangus]|uniref:Extracellular membrane protein CFEM domain-containing protein n=1 Tax=Furculomyces boomerangus TaxID=61424 RepID=A0A2T9YYF6_9FUNG|nr:hypothetical protein BB559_002071 [Furculomyces boomerangus]